MSTGEGADDDGLGYYPDGVKRTLTDEQIAMFRHSEIQTLLRERRRRDNAESDIMSDAPSKSPQPVGDGNTDTDSKRARQPSLSASDSHASEKRKWQKFIEVSETNPEHLTHRRIARELDEQKASSIDLAYGHEGSTDPAPSKRPKSTLYASDGRQQVAYSDSDHVGSIHRSSKGFHKPNFLWPTLGHK